MMRAILEGAVNWMRAGLPMKCMKIVIYRRDPSKYRRTYNKDDVVELFEKFKSKIEKSQEKKRKENEVPHFPYSNTSFSLFNDHHFVLI